MRGRRWRYGAKRHPVFQIGVIRRDVVGVADTAVQPVAVLGRPQRSVVVVRAPMFARLDIASVGEQRHPEALGTSEEHGARDPGRAEPVVQAVERLVDRR